MTEQKFSNGYALLIGVGESFTKKWSLPVTVKDAKALHGVLTNPHLCAYDPDHIRLIHDDKATKDGILNGLTWLKDQSAADADATVIVYYSGHGWLDKETSQYRLVPHDIDSEEVLESGLPARIFTDAVCEIQSRRRLVIMDCCHAGGMAASKEAAIQSAKGFKGTSPPDDWVNRLKKGTGRAVFMSSTGEQLSWILPDQTMSIYTHCLIEGLQGANNRPGDTVVALSDVMNHLGKAVPESAKKHWAAAQTPFFDMAAEDFPIAMIKGGKGLPSGGWAAMKEDIRSDARYYAHVNGGGTVVQGNGNVATGQDGFAIGGNVEGGIHVTRGK